MNEKETAIMYLKSIVAILDQPKNYPADMEIVNGYMLEAKAHLDRYNNEVDERAKNGK